MQRVAVVAKLKAGSAERAKELIEQGPPFDPDELGFERHHVYLSEELAIFVFEGARIGALIRTIAATGGGARKAMAEWEPLIDGMPRVANEAFFWERASSPGWVGGWGE